MTADTRTDVIICSVVFLALGAGLYVAFSVNQRTWNRTAITRAEFESVELGARRSIIVERFGPVYRPTRPTKYTVDEPTDLRCIHYNNRGKRNNQRADANSTFRFCFDESDVLQHKATVGRDQGL